MSRRRAAGDEEEEDDLSVFWRVVLCMDEGAGRGALAEAFDGDVQVVPVAPSEDVLGLIAHLSPDLVVLASPFGENLSLLDSLHLAHPGLRVVVLTLGSTLAREGFLERLSQMGASRYVELPIDPAEFRARIETHLAARGSGGPAPDTRKRLLRAGEIVYLENETGRECYIVNSGRVSLSRALNRYTLQGLAAAGPGELFGEMALLEDGRRSSTAIAAEDTIVSVVTRESFDSVMAPSPRFALKLLDMFLRRYFEARERADPSLEVLGEDASWLHREVGHFTARPGPKPELPRRELSPGELLFMPGAGSKTLHWIVEGVVQVDRSPLDGLEPSTSSLVSRDSPVGELAFLTGEPLDIGAVAVERTVTALVSRDDFTATAAARPSICLELARRLAERIRLLDASLGMHEVQELA